MRALQYELRPRAACARLEMATAEDVQEYVERFEKELNAVMQFWLAHSHDEKHGQVTLHAPATHPMPYNRANVPGTTAGDSTIVSRRRARSMTH